MCKIRPSTSAAGDFPFSANWLLASIVVLFSPIGAAPAKSKDRLTVQVGGPVVVTRQPSRVWKDNRWFWFPQISRFSTGELMVGCWMSNDERYPEGSDFGGYCISRDGGRWMSQEDATVSFPRPVRVEPPPVTPTWWRWDRERSSWSSTLPIRILGAGERWTSDWPEYPSEESR